MSRVDLSIGQRLAVGFGTILVPLALLIGVASCQNQRINDQYVRLNTVILPRAEAAGEVLRAHLNQTIAIRSYVFTADGRYLQDYHQGAQEGRAALIRLGQLPKDEDGQALFSDIMALSERHDRMAEQFLAQIRQPESDAARRSADIGLDEARAALSERIGAFQDLQIEKQKAALAAVGQFQEQMLQTRVALAALIGGLGAAVAFFTAKAVRAPARQLVAAARALGAGDYPLAVTLSGGVGRTPSTNQHPRDELRELGQAFGRMAGLLQRREERLAARNRVSATLAASMDVERLAAAALQETAAYTACEVGAAYLWHPETARFQRVASYALDGTAPSLGLGEGIPGQAAAERRTIVVRDIPADAPFRIRFGFEDLPPRTIVAAPMVIEAQAVGVLLRGSVRDLSDDALGFIDLTARQLGVSLQNALAHRRITGLVEELQEANALLSAQNEELQAQGEEIQAQNEEIQAQNEELHRQQAGLVEAGRLKDEFLSVAAHELKTPLTSLKGYVQLLLRRAERHPQLQEFAPYLKAVDQQTNTIAARINRLLDVSRAQVGRLQMHFAPADLAAVVESQVRQAQARTETHRVVLERRGGPLLGTWDQEYLEHAIGNLLDNAIRYSPDGGKILVTVQAEDGEARVAVQDFGIGIPADALPQLFQPYFRHDEAKQLVAEGMGIGLYLTREIVAAHGGRITVDSEPGRGTTVTIALPQWVTGEDGPPRVLVPRSEEHGVAQPVRAQPGAPGN